MFMAVATAEGIHAFVYRERKRESVKVLRTACDRGC